METSPQLLTAEQHSDSETRQTLDQRREEIIIKVFEVLSEHFDVPADDIEMHNTLIDDFNADSISITALDAALAVAFGVDTGRIVGRCYSQFGFREILDAP
ncbi:hypothetical protein KKG16_03565, partial [Patescibacteria group bacterium]|nr:hypothetical protein [Patescibacteria group bacterium]